LTTQTSEQIWNDLEANLPTGEYLIAKAIINKPSPRLLYALDAEKQRHILIVLRLNETGIEDTRSRGISVLSRDLQVHGQPSSSYIDIVCHDVVGHSAFDLIGNEITLELEDTEKEPSEIVRRIIMKWRRFWGQVPQQILSRDEVIGLIAEIWFLTKWLIPAIGPSTALKRWRGPFGARHDFEWGERSIEVKASTSTRGRLHYIHGLEQLEPPENGDLYLFSLKMREEDGGEVTLPYIIEECNNQLISDEDTLTQFETALIQTGYSPIHNDEYIKIHMRVIDEALFSVKDNFPRLTHNCILGDLSSGIEYIEYIINLNGYDNLIVARSPLEYVSF